MEADASPVPPDTPGRGLFAQRKLSQTKWTILPKQGIPRKLLDEYDSDAALGKSPDGFDPSSGWYTAGFYQNCICEAAGFQGDWEPEGGWWDYGRSKVDELCPSYWYLLVYMNKCSKYCNKPL